MAGAKFTCDSMRISRRQPDGGTKVDRHLAVPLSCESAGIRSPLTHDLLTAPFRKVTTMWKCGQCGESVEDNFDICWNCEAVKDGVIADDRDQEPVVAAESESDTGDESVPGEIDPTMQTEDDTLEKLLKLQKDQHAILLNLQSKVGCLFAYMVFGIAIGVLAFLLAILSR